MDRENIRNIANPNGTARSALSGLEAVCHSAGRCGATGPARFSVHDMNDIAFSANAAAKIESSAPGALDHFKEAGFRFDAGQEV